MMPLLHPRALPGLCLIGLLALLLPTLRAANPVETTKLSALKPDGRLTAVFAPGEESRWLWTVTEKEALSPEGGELNWELEFWNGEKESGQSDIPAGSAEVKFGFLPKKRGWATVRAVLKDRAGKTRATSETTLVIGDAPVRSERTFRYGIIGGMRSSGDDYKRAIELMDKLGADLVRGDFEWGSIEPAPGDWRFERQDRILADLKARHMEMQGILCYTVQWGSTGNRAASNWLVWARAMPEMGSWLEYVRATVKRYKGTVRYWEIWNEPDIGFWQDTTDNYVRLFNETAKAIREIDPAAVILNGGLAFAPNERNPKFREDFLARADKTNWNLRAYHDYHTFQQMTERYPEHRALYQRSTLTALPIWINEGGFHTLVRDGERQQAINLTKKLSSAPSFPGVTAYIWYNLNDIKPEGNDPEHRFGVVDYYFRPKPSYGAYQYLIRELASRKYLARPEDKTGLKGVWMQLYQGRDDHRLVVWQEAAKGLVPVALKWAQPKTQVKSATDLMGNPVPVARWRGQTMVTIGNEPIYVTLQGEAAYPVSERFLDLPDTLALLPGAKPELAFTLQNPGTEPLQATVTVRLENGTEKPVVTQVNVPVGDSRRVVLDVPILANQTAAEGRMKIEVQPAGSDGVLQATIPYEKAAVIPRALEKGATEYPVELSKATQVVNLFDAQGRSDQAWRGAEDLSARGGLSYDDRGLKVRLVVTDDRHAQAERAVTLWRGDSVQLAMRLASPGATPLELTLGVSDSGEPVGWIQNTPEGGTLPAGGIDPALLPFKVERSGNLTTYTLTIPWTALGRKSVPADGFRFNFLVNDNDGDGRRQWIELAPGIGKQKDTSLFPLMICK